MLTPKKRSLLNLIRAILTAPNVRIAEKKKVLRKVIAWYTEAEGKFNTQYRTQKVYLLLGDKKYQSRLPKTKTKIQLEHVYPIKDTIGLLFNNSSNLEQLLNNHSATCLITIEEHQRLTLSKAVGWDRYKELGITVVSLEK